MPKESLGELEHQVLLALLRQGDEGHTVTVVQELEKRTGRELASAAVYITLRRLEEKGLVASTMREADVETGGRERRYFAVTSTGLERLREARRAYLNLWNGLDLAAEQPG
ncbi:MAG TPA: helix-turn-helix transcriptional regulator [Longimicrobiales bacterium]|nr:helix-turn-helix transcriptional regulator [Longimicrobiales bacterium]